MANSKSKIVSTNDVLGSKTNDASVSKTNDAPPIRTNEVLTPKTNEVSPSQITAFSSSDKKILLRFSQLDVTTQKDILTMAAQPQTHVIVNGTAKDDKEGWTGVYAQSSGYALYAKSEFYAGYFEGEVHIEGDLTQETGTVTLNTVRVKDDIMLANADCAEDFDIAGEDKIEPGTVMVLNTEGSLSKSELAYDKHVAGVISGAEDYKPGIILDKQQTSRNRQPIALMGKVFCKVDAQYGSIEVGDLLTTSLTPGHAMKTTDPFKAFGAVIGKALRSLSSGQGLIPILIALQ